MDYQRHTVGVYNKIAPLYVEKYFSDFTDAPYIDRFLQNLPAHGSILDAGCGAGQFSYLMQSRGFNVTGIDLSDAMLSLAQGKVRGVEFLKMDIENLTFAASTFDGILAAYSLIHIPDERVTAVLRGFAQVLKPNGFLLLISQRGEPDHLVTEPLKPDEQIFFNFFTLERLRWHLQNANFVVESEKEIPTVDAYSLSDTILYVIARKKMDKENA